MEFKSTKNMTHDTAPEGVVLVQYLKPFFGVMTVEYGVGYYDNPNDYEDGNGAGWCLWDYSQRVDVIAYAVLPEKLNIKRITSALFEHKYGARPNLGSVGELIEEVQDGQA